MQAKKKHNIFYYRQLLRHKDKSKILVFQDQGPLGKNDSDHKDDTRKSIYWSIAQGINNILKEANMQKKNKKRAAMTSTTDKEANFNRLIKD